MSRSRRKIHFSHWWLLLALWLAGAVPEVVLHIASAKNSATMLNSGMLLGLLFAIVPGLVVFTLISIIPKKGINLAFCITYSAIYALLAASQLVYYKIFGVFYSAYSMVNGGAAAQFWQVALRHILQNLHWMILILLPLLFFSIIAWRIFQFNGLKSRIFGLIPAVAAIFLHFLLVAILPALGGTEDLSPYNLYYYNTDSYYSINKLGLLTGFRLDMHRFVTGDEPEGTLNLDAIMPSFQWPTFPTTTRPTIPPTGTMPGGTQGTIPGSSIGPTMPTQPPAPPIDTSPNVLDIDFDGLINSASNNQIKEMHQYFKNRIPSAKNEYTGIFEGCNLIMICAEGFSTAIIDENRTPTLYKMMSEGIYLENYYVPLWGVSTTDGEYAFLTGTLPKSGVWSFSKSSGNAMPLTMSQQLIAQGYNAYAYHGHTYTYYNRNKYLANLGFQYKGVGNGLHINSKIWPESDWETVDQSTADFVGNSPFVTYYMSISGHLEYTFNDNMMAWKNRAEVANEPYSDNVRAYLACQLEFEKSLELLLQRLEEAGVLENTVIVITADHYPYGLTEEEYSELQGHQLESNFELYKNGCIIYKPGIEPQVVTELSSHIDLLPTLSNMFGLEFDSRLYMGRDIFSDAMALVMFQNRSWITDFVKYNADTKEYTYLVDTDIPQEYLDYIKAEVSNRFTISSRILDHDYWRILFGDQ